MHMLLLVLLLLLLQAPYTQAVLQQQQQQQQPPSPKKAKNILYIIVDDLTADFSIFGGKIQDVPLPHLSNFISRPASVNFLRAYAQQAVCGPSRNSFLAGRYPDELQTYTFRRSFRDAFPDAISLPQAFKQQTGALTCGFGKVYHDDGILSPPNYDEPYSWSSDECKYYAPKEEECDKNQHRHGWCTPDMPDGNFTDGLVTDAAIERLRAHVTSGNATSGRPFFFAVGIRKPHMDWIMPKRFLDAQMPQEKIKLPPDNVRVGSDGVPPVSWWNCTQEGPWQLAMPEVALFPNQPLADDLEQELRRAYYAATSWCDEVVGKLLNALQELGLEDDTAVVLHSDHGFHLSEEGMWCKQNTREIGARVPLVISVPGLTPSPPSAPVSAPPQQAAQSAAAIEARVSHAIVELVDIYPTMMEFAGLPLPEPDLRGKSLVPLLLSATTHTCEKDNKTDQDKDCTSSITNTSTKASTTTPTSSILLDQGRAFTQYPRCASLPFQPSSLATEGYLWNRQCAMLENHLIDVMGYSVRVHGWRYGEWWRWDAKKWLPVWVPPTNSSREEDPNLVAAELYVMDEEEDEQGKEKERAVSRSKYIRTSPTPNVIDDPRNQQVRQELSQILYEHFSSLQRSKIVESGATAATTMAAMAIPAGLLHE